MSKLINHSTMEDGVLYNLIPYDLEYDKIVFFPDACPSRGLLPTGTSVLTRQPNWRKFVISDVGCGMMLLKSKINVKEFNCGDWDKLYKLLKESKNTQADLGSGNHFLNCYVDNISKDLFFLIHTGSRLEGESLEDLIDNPEEFDKKYRETIEWAKGNRLGIKALVDQVFGETKMLIDKEHNSFEETEDGVIIRKGTVRLNENEISMIPSTMEGSMVLIRGRNAVNDVLNSCSHGTGRVMSRGEAKEQADLYDYEALRRNIYIPKDISTASIRTEAPFCYRDIDDCLLLIDDFAEEIQRFIPIAYIGQL